MSATPRVARATSQAPHSLGLPCRPIDPRDCRTVARGGMIAAVPRFGLAEPNGDSLGPGEPWPSRLGIL